MDPVSYAGAVATDAVGDGWAVVGARGGSFLLADRRNLA